MTLARHREIATSQPLRRSPSAMHRLLRLELDDSPPGEYTVRLTIIDGAGRDSLPLATSLRVR